MLVSFVSCVNTVKKKHNKNETNEKLREKTNGMLMKQEKKTHTHKPQQQQTANETLQC